jgi:hypothetical protein
LEAIFVYFFKKCTIENTKTKKKQNERRGWAGNGLSSMQVRWLALTFERCIVILILPPSTKKNATTGWVPPIFSEYYSHL